MDIQNQKLDAQNSNLSFAYCSRVMSSFSGEIQYLSHGDEMSEFLLGFPALNS
jgi:hypothetical protein